MKTNRYQPEYGSIAFNVTMIMLLVMIGILTYLLIGNHSYNAGRNIGTDSVQIEDKRQRIPSIHKTDADEFHDGLGQPNATTEYPLDDVGAGLVQVDTFRYDINNDGRMDRIIRSRIENGTSHFSYEYTIKLNTVNGFIDITPPDFNTIEGAECALQKIKFSFTPTFRAIKISRPWHDTWTTPTAATIDVYGIDNNAIDLIDTSPMPIVCDVSELF